MKIRTGLGLSLVTLVAIAALVLLTQPVAMQFFSATMGHWTLGGISLLTIILEALIFLPVCRKNSSSNPSVRAERNAKQLNIEALCSNLTSHLDIPTVKKQYTNLKDLNEKSEVIRQQVANSLDALVGNGGDPALLREQLKLLKILGQRTGSAIDQLLTSIV